MPEEYEHKLSAKTETSERCFYKPTVGSLEHMLSMTAVMKCLAIKKKERSMGLHRISLREQTRCERRRCPVPAAQRGKGKRRAEGEKREKKRFIKRMGLHNNLSAWVVVKIDRNSEE